MRYIKFLPIAVLIFASAGCSNPQGSGTPKSAACPAIAGTVTVELNDGNFNPEITTVKKCTEVVFKNVGKQAHWPASDFHPTHGIYPEFDPLKNVEPGQSWSFVFDRTGKWHYHDHLFPAITGTVEVTE